MKPTDSHDPEAVLEEEATVWLFEREDGFAPGRSEAFAEWCSSNPRHAEAVARVERTLAILNEMPAVRKPLEERVGRATANAPEVRPLARDRFNRWAWAASIAATLVIGATVWWTSQPPAAGTETYEAIGSEPRRVSLADGSVVDLNSNSRVAVQFSEGERRITLEAGEAHFQVAHNSARPFTVTANGVSVRAVGTAFNVRLTEDKVDVLVAEGKVEVDRQESSVFFTTRKIPVIPLLVAGERTQVASNNHSAPRVEMVAPAEVHSLLAWQNRMTSFADVPLREMVARINRCNSLQLVIGDPQLGDRKVGGVIDLNQVNAFVHLLEQDGDVVAERGPGEKIVLRRAR